MIDATPSARDSTSPTEAQVQPGARALAALKALTENRLDDARTNVEEMPGHDPSDRAWKALLSGQIALAEGDLRTAESDLQTAAALALDYGLRDSAVAPKMFRLAARALNALGRTHRRRERLGGAARAHRAAYHLRAEYGSEDERWESAMDAGLDHHLARQPESAAEWLRRSLEHARRAVEEPLRKQALALGELCATLRTMERLDDAVAAARSARSLWRECDPGCRDGFRAELRVGHALLVQAQAQLDSNPEQARAHLEESIHCLAAARDELAAFGPEVLSDLRSCEDQLDFAGRLRASLDEVHTKESGTRRA